MSSLKIFLICTWGRPEEWERVGYRLIDEKSGIGIYVESKTSVKALLEYLYQYAERHAKAKSNVDIALIVIALDTLAPSVFGSQPEGLREYSDITRKVEEYIREKLKSFGIQEHEKAHIIIAPGIGTFYPRKGGQPNYPYKFVGQMTDFYNVVLYKLSEVIMSRLDVGSSIELHLDLTHGINFMPALTYKAVTRIASILALTHKVKLRVYNAEPYVRPPGQSQEQKQTQEPPELQIHIIEDRKVKSELPVQWPDEKSPDKCLKILSAPPNQSMEVFGKNVSESLEKYSLVELECCDQAQRSLIGLGVLCSAFTSSVKNGLPLVLIYTWKKLAQNNVLDSVVKEIYGLWMRNIALSKVNGGVLVTRNLSFTDTFTAYVETWLAHRVLADIMSGMTDVKLQCIEDSEKKGRVAFLTKWGYVKDLYEKLYKKLSSRLDAVMSHDISYEFKDNIECGIKSGKTCRLIPYEEIAQSVREDKPKNDSKQIDIQERNFLAHSGLLYQITAIHIPQDVKDTEEESIRKIEVGYYYSRDKNPILPSILKTSADHA